MKVLGIIPARGGSKGISRKNVRELGGKPLIMWTIEAAIASRALDSVMVSTDNEEIAGVARAGGAEVPFLRPAALATDEAASLDVVLDVLQRLPGFDAVMLLQPTSPLRTAADVAGCVAFAAEKRARSVTSVYETQSHPAWMYRLDAEGHVRPLLDTLPVTRRQDLPKVFSLNGAMYYNSCEHLLRTRAFVTTYTLGYVMPAERSVDIDDDHDWTLAESLLKAVR